MNNATDTAMDKVVPLFRNAATAAIRSTTPLAREMSTEFARAAAQAGAVLAVYAVAIGGTYVAVTTYQKMKAGLRRLRKGDEQERPAVAA